MKEFETINRLALVKGPYTKIKAAAEILANFDGTLVIDCVGTLTSGEVFSPVSAYHLKRYISSEVTTQVTQENIHTIVLFGLKALFFDPNIIDDEHIVLLKSIFEHLKKALNEHNIAILTFDEEYEAERSKDIDAILNNEIGVRLAFEEIEALVH